MHMTKPAKAETGRCVEMNFGHLTHCGPLFSLYHTQNVTCETEAKPASDLSNTDISGEQSIIKDLFISVNYRNN